MPTVENVFLTDEENGVPGEIGRSRNVTIPIDGDEDGHSSESSPGNVDSLLGVGGSGAPWFAPESSSGHFVAKARDREAESQAQLLQTS